MVGRADASASGLAGGGRRPGPVGVDQPGAGVEVGGLQQALGGHVDEVGVAEIAVAVGVHQPAGLAEQIPALGVAPVGADVGALKDAEPFQHRWPAGGRGRHADQIDAVGPADGGAGLRLVGRQVLQRHGAGHRSLLQPGDDLLGDGAFQQRLGALGCDPAQGRGVGGVAHGVAGLDLHPVGPGEIGDGVGLGGLRRARTGRLGHPPGRREAVVGQLLGRRKQRVPGQPAMLALRQIEHGDGARHAGRAAGDHGLALVHRLAVGAVEQLWRRRRRRGLAAVVGAHPAGFGVIDGHERPAAEAGTLRLHQAQHRLHSDGGVDSRAAGLQHLQARLDGHRIGRGDHGGGAGDDLDVMAPHPVRQQRRGGTGEDEGGEAERREALGEGHVAANSRRSRIRGLPSHARPGPGNRAANLRRAPACALPAPRLGSAASPSGGARP